VTVARIPLLRIFAFSLRTFVRHLTITIVDGDRLHTARYQCSNHLLGTFRTFNVLRHCG
jgi:hypothetical protein